MNLNFFVLNTKTQQEYLKYVVDFVLDKYSQAECVCIFLNRAMALKLDNKLWNDRLDSFMPHAFVERISDYDKYKNIKVIITDNIFIAKKNDLLINLSSLPIDIINHKIDNIIEIVDQEPQNLQHSRDKYIFYKKCGIYKEIKTTKI